jgi:hypothetical protein
VFRRAKVALLTDAFQYIIGQARHFSRIVGAAAAHSAWSIAQRDGHRMGHWGSCTPIPSAFALSDDARYLRCLPRRVVFRRVGDSKVVCHIRSVSVRMGDRWPL